jgi:hypothetical protein
MRKLILLACVAVPIMAGAQSPGTVVGRTYMDIQSAGPTGNRVAVGSDGSVFFAWMNALNFSRPRHVYFNHLDNVGHWFAPGTGDRVFDDSITGYCQVAMVYGNRGAIACHAGASAFSILGIDSEPPGYGIFGRYNIPDLLPNDSRAIYPFMAIDQHNRAHIMMTENWIAHTIESIGYARLDLQSGNWWPNATSPALVDTTGWPSVLVAASPVSDKVVIAYSKPIDTISQLWNDIYYVLSQDGINWDFANGRTNVTNYGSDNDSLWANTDLALIFDYNDNFHIAWNANWSSISNPYYSKTFLFHYSNSGQTINQIRTPWPDSQWAGVGCDVGVGNRPICKMDLGVRQADNRLYAVWTQYDTSDCSAAGYANGDIWMTYSGDGGSVWSPPQNLTNSHTPGCAAGDCDSDIYPSLADKVDSRLHLFYLNDKDAGSALHNEGSATLNPMLYFSDNSAIDINNTIALSFSLNQNYPNPFNAQTSISYSIDQPTNLELAIYNVLGEKVTCLFKGKQASGIHKVIWNAEMIPSGVYFAVLRAEKSRQIKQITLIK